MIRQIDRSSNLASLAFSESVCEMLSEISKTVPCQVPVQTKEGRFFFTEVFPIGGENSRCPFYRRFHDLAINQCDKCFRVFFLIVQLLFFFFGGGGMGIRKRQKR